MVIRGRLAIGVAAAGLVVVTGCSSSGSSGSSATTSSPTPTMLDSTAYSLALNAILVSETGKHGALDVVSHAKTVAKVQQLLTTFANDQASAALRLNQLQAPAEDASAQAQLVQAFTHNATAVRALIGQVATATTVQQALALIEDDPAATRAGQEVDDALKALAHLAY
jgi:hypothetical protein